MKFIGREIAITQLLRTGFVFLKMLPRLYIVKHPFTIFKHYFQQSSPKYIEMRGGVRIILSSHPHDIKTFFVVFLKREYGSIKPNSVVIDVGANIGIFSLYAVLSGAKKVYAFEPSKEAFEVLCENVKYNNLTGIIIPINKAVSNNDGDTIRFPCSSSPYNTIKNNNFSNQQDFCKIQTITLNFFISKLHDIDHIDFLKLDCEGSEFDIVPSTDESTLAKINVIRMECHDKPILLINYLKQKGFIVDLINANIVWLSRH